MSKTERETGMHVRCRVRISGEGGKPALGIGRLANTALLSVGLSIGLTAVPVRAWIFGTHEEVARTILRCPEIRELFSKTGWSVDRVALYARRADLMDEKNVFPGSTWGSISDYDLFEKNYLTYASAGERVVVTAPYWRNKTTGRAVDPGEVPSFSASSMEWTLFKTNNEYYDPPDVVHGGEFLFGVLLHHVADISVPVGGHSPGSQWCHPGGISEPLYEGKAGLKNHNLSCEAAPDYRALVKPYTEENVWNNATSRFASEIQTYSEAECARICALSLASDQIQYVSVSQDAPESTQDEVEDAIVSQYQAVVEQADEKCTASTEALGSYARSCLLASVGLAKLVVSRYLKATREYKAAGEAAVRSELVLGR